MGIADRQLVEKLTSQVIQRLEQPPMLPGMEHLMPRAPAQVVQHTSDADILAVVREFLSVEKPVEEELPAEPPPCPPPVETPPVLKTAKETKKMPTSTKARKTAPSGCWRSAT